MMEEWDAHDDGSTRSEKCVLSQDLFCEEAEHTNIPAIPKIPDTAHLVRRSIWSLHIIKMGRDPRIISHVAAIPLYI